MSANRSPHRSLISRLTGSSLMMSEPRRPSTGGASLGPPPHRAFSLQTVPTRPYMCEDGHRLEAVPTFLIDAFHIIRTNGLNFEGLFRKEGSAVRMKGLWQRIINNEKLPGDTPLTDVCSLIKRFFREIQTPLLSTIQNQFVLSFVQCQDDVIRVKAVLEMCHVLPREHKSTLAYLMRELQFIANNQTCENKMDEHNLATVFAETLFRDYDDSVAAASGWPWLPDATLHHMSAAQAEAHSRQMASVHRSVDVKINLLKLLIIHACKIAVLSKHDQILSPGMYDDLPLFGDGSAAGTGGSESRRQRRRTSFSSRTEQPTEQCSSYLRAMKNREREHKIRVANRQLSASATTFYSRTPAPPNRVVAVAATLDVSTSSPNRRRVMPQSRRHTAPVNAVAATLQRNRPNTVTSGLRRVPTTIHERPISEEYCESSVACACIHTHTAAMGDSTYCGTLECTPVRRSFIEGNAKDSPPTTVDTAPDLMIISLVGDEAESSLAPIATGSGERRQYTPAKRVSPPPTGTQVNVNLWTTDFDDAPSVLSPALNTRSRTRQRSIVTHVDEHHNEFKSLVIVDPAEDAVECVARTSLTPAIDKMVLRGQAIGEPPPFNLNERTPLHSDSTQASSMSSRRRSRSCNVAGDENDVARLDLSDDVFKTNGDSVDHADDAFARSNAIKAQILTQRNSDDMEIPKYMSTVRPSVAAIVRDNRGMVKNRVTAYTSISKPSTNTPSTRYPSLVAGGTTPISSSSRPALVAPGVVRTSSMLAPPPLPGAAPVGAIASLARTGSLVPSVGKGGARRPPLPVARWSPVPKIGRRLQSAPQALRLPAARAVIADAVAAATTSASHNDGAPTSSSARKVSDLTAPLASSHALANVLKRRSTSVSSPCAADGEDASKRAKKSYPKSPPLVKHRLVMTPNKSVDL